MQPSSFETLCTSETPQTHLISYIYALLFETVEADAEIACVQWNRKLNVPLSKEAWEMIHARLLSSSRNVVPIHTRRCIISPR